MVGSGSNVICGIGWVGGPLDLHIRYVTKRNKGLQENGGQLTQAQIEINLCYLLKKDTSKWIFWKKWLSQIPPSNIRWTASACTAHARLSLGRVLCFFSYFLTKGNLQSWWEDNTYTYKQLNSFTEPRILIQDMLWNGANYKKEELELCPEGREKCVKKGERNRSPDWRCVVTKPWGSGHRESTHLAGMKWTTSGGDLGDGSSKNIIKWKNLDAIW